MTSVVSHILPNQTCMKGASHFEVPASLPWVKSKFDSIVSKDVYMPVATELPLRITQFTQGVTVFPEELKVAIIDACGGLAKGIRLQPIEEGMSGSYFVRDAEHKSVGVFKPLDEEPCAPNNPKGLSGQIGDTGIKKGIRSGEQALREAAAYLIDNSSPIKAGVPPTVLVSIRSELRGSMATKEGSFQMFVPSASPCGDFSSSMFDLRQVQAIAVLDMRLLNTDRHDGNILVQKASLDHATGTHRVTLVPIDHGCCLPDNLEVSCFEWVWLTWSQVNKPILPEVRELILSIDVDRDAALLSKIGIRVSCIRSMRLATVFLQTCVRVDPELTLFEIGNMMSRQDLSEPSEFECLVLRCKWQALLDSLLDRETASRSFSARLEARLVVNTKALMVARKC
eukprot:c3076_g1_i1.p1 GENE.c3076_g1_i1~~c3076_g1_i1.p1  ORF type:complete len:397 (-),score=84.43 c3076_g1_i1:423-1613(-)